MVFDQEKQLIKDVFSKERWIPSLERFIQVLKINIFVADRTGCPIIHPCATVWGEGYGCRILTRLLGLDEVGQGQDFLKNFLPYGDYLESRTKLDLHVFAVPLKVYDHAAAYMIVGPVITNKRLPDEEYCDLARRENITIEGLLDELRGIRAVSHVAMVAILDLLAAISKDFIDIGLENRRLRKMRFQKEILPHEVADTAAGLYREIHCDELLISTLDVALRLTGAESGSIMVFDKDRREMVVRVSRGLGDDYARKARARMGQGVAGVAAQENKCFFIKGRGEGVSEKIRPFLKRPEIKEAVVMPISQNNRVFGVINLHTESEGVKIEENMGYLIGLSRLLSTAVFS